MRKRFLFLSAFFPNPSAPNIATYNRQQLTALTEFYDIDAVVPIPWVDRVRSSIPEVTRYGRIEVHHPTYYYTPLIFRRLYGAFYYRSVAKTVARLTAGRTYDFVYSSWLYPDAWVAATVARNLDIPLFAAVHGTDVNRLKPGTFLAGKALEVAHAARRVKCVSVAIQRKLIELGADPEKLFVLQNGVDSSIFYPSEKGGSRAELGISAGSKMILFVGNLKKEKGLEELTRAFSQIGDKIADVRLFVIGGGRYRQPLIDLARKCGVTDRIVLLGERPLSDVAKYMNACDVLCLPSYMEGKPNVILEAFSCRTRVVATNVGGIPELDDGSGKLILVPPRTVPELAHALEQALSAGADGADWLPLKSWEQNALYLKEVFQGPERPPAHPVEVSRAEGAVQWTF